MSLALALDTLGNQMLMEASRRLQDRILADVTKRGLTMAGELRAGDPGLALEAQPAVLRLAGGATIGVTITRIAGAGAGQVDVGHVRRRPRSAAGALVALRRLPFAQDLRGGAARRGRAPA